MCFLADAFVQGGAVQLESAQRIAIRDTETRLAAAPAETDRTARIGSVDQPHLVPRPGRARHPVLAIDLQRVLAEPCLDAGERGGAAVAETAGPGKAWRLRKRQARNYRRCRVSGAAGSIERLYLPRRNSRYRASSPDA